MNLEERLSLLERNHDWSGLQETLEQGIAGSDNPSVQAEYHLRLGRLLRERFMQGVKALKHFQDAFKLNAALLDALAEARQVYWELGKLNMVQKLLELQLKSDASGNAALFCQLGSLLSDLGDDARATEAYAKAAQAANGRATNAAELLRDVQVGEGDWQPQVAGLIRTARDAKNGAEKAQAFLRASRIARRFAPDEVENLLSQAYAANPTDVVVACLLEDLLARAGRTDAILEQQRAILGQLTEPIERSRVAFVRNAMGDAAPEPRARRRVHRAGSRGRSVERSGVRLPPRNLRHDGRRLGSCSPAR